MTDHLHIALQRGKLPGPASHTVRLHGTRAIALAYASLTRSGRFGMHG